MALDLTGIENVEFYSGHYLDAVLEGDLKGLFETWKKAEDERGVKAPFKRFNPIAGAWEKARKQASGEPDPVERWKAARAFHAELIQALGYAYEPDVARLEDDKLVPLVSKVDRNGRPYLWIVDAPFPSGDGDEALDAELLREQYPASVEGAPVQVVPRSLDPMRKAEPATWRELLDTTLFRLDLAPRWILFLAGDELYLAERHKWPAGRFLRFDLGALFARRQAAALRAFCALLHRDALAPDDGGCLHDSLEEKSHKHAYAVSGDLKYGVRRAIELLANEAVWYRRTVQKKGVFEDPLLAEKLKDDCLTYMYRLLFLFYVEARGAELGIVPMQSEAYRHGYSLEALRDLELVPLDTEEARNGYYLDTSLKKVFGIVEEGFQERGPQGDLYTITDEEFMRVPALRAPLFDDARLQVLNGVRFRNFVLQEVIRQLSLSAEKRGKQRGRISYAQLGISQLGAVYESLLSYTGFFADEDDGLYEVAARGDVEKIQKAREGKGGSREDVQVYFVPASKAAEYQDGEFVRDENGRKVVHEKGTFVYALAGRSREKSASFYTPEVLTNCVVKYALKELLEDENGRRKLSADEILGLTVCEPAMGSGAFLLEAVDQLADAYLAARQAELGVQIPSERYQAEKRRVKARLATNNCYGVDLNPTAVHLAQVSLWLGSMYEGGKCPWFGLRLACGNSLVGARREVFRTADVARKGTKKAPNWLGLVPEAVLLFHGEDGPAVDVEWRVPPRPKGAIYHFLLPADGMAAFDKDKVVREIAPEDAKRIQTWRNEFTQPFSKQDAGRLERLSDAVDRLWTEVVRERSLAARETTDRIPVWGESELREDGSAEYPADELLVGDQEQVAQELERSSTAYRRLKLVMDAWCALWFWPIERSAELPSREEWLASLELVLLGKAEVPEIETQRLLFEPVQVQRELPLQGGGHRSGAREPELIAAHTATAVLEAPEPSARVVRLRGLSERLGVRRRASAEECGLADVEAILVESPWLRTAQTVQDRLHFHHWELRFAEVFAERGGFDLTVGNPPWILVSFDEPGVLSDFDPTLKLRKLSAPETRRRRSGLLTNPTVSAAYFKELAGQVGIQEYLGSRLNEPLLLGMKTNLYKCFITSAWRTGSARGCAGFLHPEGVYDDPKGGALRHELYPRLVGHFQFVNEFKLFPEIGNLVKFGVSAYRPSGRHVGFVHCSNLFHPTTVEESWQHDGHGAVPGIKDEEDRFETRGHRRRLVHIDDQRLALFASLYDEPGTDPLEARLPVVHSEEIVSVLRRFGDQPRRLGDISDQYFSTQHWNETNAVEDGTIRRETRFPNDVSEWILQGPHFHVAAPFNKTPNRGCSSHRDYTSIDLTAIPEGYLPRTNYVSACPPDEYARRTPKWNGRPATEYYRYVNRTMVNPTGERTLVAALFPPSVAHVDLAFSIAMDDRRLLTNLVGLAAAVPLDFLVKSTGKNHVRNDVASLFPMPKLESALMEWLRGKVLELCCLTAAYREIWDDGQTWIRLDVSSFRDPRLRRRPPAQAWSRESALRTDLARRHALVEVDVLVSMALSMSLDELLTIYRVQFPVLQQYERERLYDQHGRIVPTSTTAGGNPAVSLVKLAALLADQATGFDTTRLYRPSDKDLPELRARPVKLPRRDAEVLNVPERCTLGDILAPTEVRWYDDEHPDGYNVELLGLRYTDPGLEPRMERVYPTPWTRCDREEDYRTAWAEFERRLGTNPTREERS